MDAKEQIPDEVIESIGREVARCLTTKFNPYYRTPLRLGLVAVGESIVHPFDGPNGEPQYVGKQS